MLKALREIEETAPPPIPKPGLKKPKLAKKKIDENDPLIVINPTIKLHIHPQLFFEKAPGCLPDLYLRRTAVLRLIKAANMLPPSFFLLITDAWRSETTQEWVKKKPDRLKEQMPDPTLFYGLSTKAPLLSTTPHCTGGAVDVTLLGPNKEPWPMGLILDSNMTHEPFQTDGLEHSLPGFYPALLGRRLLYSIMTSAGFTNFPNEWWHFDYGNSFWNHFGGYGLKKFWTNKQLHLP